jgi:hypothetical protein
MDEPEHLIYSNLLAGAGLWYVSLGTTPLTLTWLCLELKNNAGICCLGTLSVKAGGEHTPAQK